LTFPVDVELLFGDGSLRREHWDGAGTSKRFEWRDKAPLRAAIVDPEDRIVIDGNLENNRATVTGSRSVGWLTLERLTYWAEILLQAVTP
jgi:hypothetical protein